MQRKKERKQNVLFHTTSAASDPSVNIDVNIKAKKTDSGVFNAIVTVIMLLTAPARENFLFTNTDLKHFSTLVSHYVYLLDFIEVNNTKNQ